jgi:DNA invertase Pin-like site-specific DNA recombinase
MEPFRLLFFLIGAATISFYDYDLGKKKNSAADPIRERPIFQKLIEEELQENDLLLVTKIDRCSRNTLDFLKLQEKLFKKSVTFISLDLPYSNDMAVN